MNDIEKQLYNTSRQVQNTIDNIARTFRPALDATPALRAELDRLDNRAREFEHGTFITLVVGPAKSGKSTLVNLIAGAYVSPTNFLECTVRPSIISRRADGTENSITCYSSMDSARRVEQIDSIIDCIRGFADDTALADVTREVYPLTDENIKDKVELSLDESLDSETLLTSIRTPGGRLLQDRVFLIDMPGFDGAYQNIDNPVYDAIAQRADLIVFVQSSNSAFSKVSKDFLRILAQRNANVPVCLIHNVFDAAWWRPQDVKDSAISEQRLAAYNEIRKLGFGIELADCFCINLGEVTDFRSGLYPAVPQLAQAAEVFDDVEQKLYQRIINNRDTIRLTNCLKRVAQQRDRLAGDIRSEIDARRSVAADYDRTAAALAEVARVSYQPQISVAPDVETVISTAVSECNEARRMIGNGIKKNNDDARAMVATLLGAISAALDARTDAIFGIRRAADALYAEYKSVIADITHRLSAFPGFIPADILPEISIDSAPSFDVASEISIDSLVPSRALVLGFGGHDADALRGYLTSVEEVLVTSPDHLGQSQNNGRLIRNIIPEAAVQVRTAVSEAAAAYAADIDAYIARVSASILAAIIPDRPAFDSLTASLEQLLAKLETLKLKAA